ncbi:hypothetical protein HK097_003373, partial [Rhizophlyctis rosea]
MPSVNSEVSARRPVFGRSESKDGVSRPPRPPGQQQPRSYSTRMERVPSSQNESPRRGRTMHEGEYEDLWDTPVSVGSFTGNGTFNTPEEEAKASKGQKPVSVLGTSGTGRESPTPLRTASPASFHDERPLQAASPPKHIPGALHMPSPSRQSLAVGERFGAIAGPSHTNSDPPVTSTFNNTSGTGMTKSSSFVDIFNPFASTTLAGNVPSVGSPAVKHEVLGVERRHTPDPIGARSSSTRPEGQPAAHGGLPPGIGATAQPFSPPKWQYKDPVGNVQGPFSHTQMHDWYKMGYFTDDLPVKRLEDYNHEPLARLIHKYGRDAPFLRDVEELERLHALQNEQRRINALNVAPGLKDLYGDANPAGLGFNAFGGFGGPGASGGGVGLNPGFGGDVFGGGIGRDMGAGFPGGVDTLTGAAYGRTGWGETHGVGRTGWNGLNQESSFLRAPASPSAASFGGGQYFDQRINQPIPQHSYMGGIMGQQQAAAFGLGAGPQTPGGSAAANLFSAQPLFDSFGVTQPTTPSVQTPRQQDWNTYPLDEIRTTLGGTATAFTDDGVGHIDDVVSKLVEDASPVQEFAPESSIAQIDEAVRKQQQVEQQQQQMNTEQGLVDRLKDLNIVEAPAGVAPISPPKAVAKSPVEEKEKVSPVAVSPAAKKEEKKAARKEEAAKRKEEKALVEEKPAPAPPTPAPTPAVPSVDLRSIMSEEESRSKKEKAQKALAKQKEFEKEVEEAQKKAAKAGVSVWAAPAPKVNDAAPKLSLKEIQEREEKEREEKERERQRRAREMVLLQAQQIQEQEAAAAAAQWSGRGGETGAGGPAVWGSTPKPAALNRGKSLSEIMLEEETKKKKDEKSGGGQGG